MPLTQLYLLNNNEGENTTTLNSNNYKYHRILQSIFCKKKIQNWEKQKSFPSLVEFKDSQTNNPMKKDSSNSSLDTTFDPRKVVQTMALELNLIDIYKIAEKLCTLLANEHVKFHSFFPLYCSTFHLHGQYFT
jgi:tRNA G10  N-methylase Trm11